MYNGFICLYLLLCSQGVLRWWQSCPEDRVAFVISAFCCLPLNGLRRSTNGKKKKSNQQNNPETVVNPKVLFFPQAQSPALPSALLLCHFAAVLPRQEQGRSLTCPPAGTALGLHTHRAGVALSHQGLWSRTSGNTRKDSVDTAFELCPAKLSSALLPCWSEQPLCISPFLPLLSIFPASSTFCP